MYAVCGTQADQPSNNKVTVMKMSEMHRTSKGKKADEDENDGRWVTCAIIMRYASFHIYSWR